MKDLTALHLKIKSTQLIKSLILGNFRAAFSGKGIEFQDFRAYSYGDDAKYIDWATSSREATTIIRRYTEERETPILCVADISSSLFFEEERTKKKLLEAVIRLIGEASMASGEKFGGYRLFQDTKKYILPRKSPLSLYEFRKDNTEIPRDSHTPLNLGFLLKNPIKGAIIFIVSDSLECDVRSLALLAKKHDLIFISLASHFENTLEGEGISLLRSSNMNFGVDLDDMQKKKQYQKVRAHILQVFRSQLQSMNIDCMFLDEKKSLEGSFLELMKRREQHKKC